MRLRLPLERICAQYGFRFFDREKSKSVASTAKRQRGLQRGKPGPAEGEMKLYHNYCRQPLSHGCAVPASLTQGSL